MNAEQILTELTLIKDEHLTELTSSIHRRIPRWGPAVAACLCVILLGTAAAVTLNHRSHVTEPVSVTRPDGTVISYFEVTTPVTKLPLSSLSAEARQFAANQTGLPAETESTSWTSAEHFLGLELADSPLLDQLGPVAIRFVGRCDAPTGIDLTLSALWKSGRPFAVTPPAANIPCTSIFVKVSIFTDAMLDSVTERHTTAYFRGTEPVTTQTYTTPSGLEITIADEPDHGGYRAVFTWKCAEYHVTVSGTESDSETFSVLKQILDSFQ